MNQRSIWLSSLAVGGRSRHLSFMVSLRSPNVSSTNKIAIQSAVPVQWVKFPPSLFPCRKGTGTPVYCSVSWALKSLLPKKAES